MADGLTWFFELLDRVTGPADKMQKALHGTSQAFKGLESAAGEGGILRQWQTTIGTVFGKGVGDKVGSFIDKGLSSLKGLDKIIPLDTLQAIGGALMGAGTMIAGFVASLAAAAVAAAAAGAAALAGITALGFKYAAESADAKRSMILGLKQQLGAGDDANAVLDEIEGWAKKTAFEKDTFTGFAKSLLGAGFKKDELKPLLGAISDVAGGDAGKGQQFLAELSKIRSTDKIGTRELAGFGSMGVSNDSIFAALADQKGTTLEQAKALFDSGNLKSQDALNAILAAIQKKSGGTLGAFGDELQSGSISAQIQHLKDGIGDLFENVNIKPITDFLNKLNTAISGPFGEKVSASINKAFAAISKLFDVDGDNLDATLDKVAEGFDKAVDWAIKFGESVVQTWERIEPPLTKLEKKLEFLMGGNSVTGSAIWTNLAFSFELFVSSIVAQFWVLEQLSDLEDDMYRIGADLVLGLWDGITEGWATMLEKFNELVALLPDSVKKVLGIASPSTVMKGLGLQTGAGFSVGLDASDIPGQLEAALQPPASPALSGITAGAFASRAGGGSQINIEMNFTIEGGSKDEDRAHQIAEQVRAVALPALMDAMEQLRIETGG